MAYLLEKCSDSGGPIKIIWKTSENISIGQIKWPTPELIPYDPLMTYGYKDFVIFPFEYVKILMVMLT